MTPVIVQIPLSISFRLNLGQTLSVSLVNFSRFKKDIGRLPVTDFVDARVVGNTENLRGKKQTNSNDFEIMVLMKFRMMAKIVVLLYLKTLV